MPTKDTAERAEIHLTGSVTDPRAAPSRQRPDRPFRMLLIGDFSGRETRGVEDLESLGFDRLPVRVDRDDLDDLMDALAVELRLRLEGGSSPTITLRPRSLDDFHPDRIYAAAPAFSRLRRLREMLDDTTTFEEAASEVRAWGLPRTDEPPPVESDGPSVSARSTSEDLVAELLERASERENSPTSIGLDPFLRNIVRPHLVSAEPSHRRELVATIEAAVGSWMRTILHDPDFQAVESSWRGLDWLLRRLETDSEVQIYVLDVSKPELSASLRSADRLESSSVYRLLVEHTVESPGAEPWSVLAGLYGFDGSLEDVALLGRLARIAQAAGAPFLSAASPRILGCRALHRFPDPDDWNTTDDAEAQLWEALRALPEASHLGLALPRFLLRLPYGKQTDPVEGFDFEELDEDAAHEEYLWGNPAFAVAAVLASEFSEFGWHLRPERGLELSGLPLHVRSEGGSVRTQPCAEALLTERAAARILDAGLMPLVSMKDRDTIRLLRIQSIAQPPARLSGPWA